MSPDDLILTKGQLFVDGYVQALVDEWWKRGTRAQTNLKVTLIREYIEVLDVMPAPHLIARVRNANEHAWADLRDIDRLKAAGEARRALEAYITDAEIAAGRYRQTKLKSREGRANAKGWTVHRDKHGVWWRAQLTSMRDGRPRSLPDRFPTKEAATQAVKAELAKIRGRAA